MKKIAIIGSSGGNLYNLGGAEPEKLLQEIYQQCEAAGVNVAAVQFIAAEASMDVAKPDTPASVYALTTENQQKPQRIFQGKLSEVNTSVVESDRQIAEMIRRGEIDGIVVMSADPVKANQAVFAAAVEMNTPIVGTGEPPWRWWRQRGRMWSRPPEQLAPPAVPAPSPSWRRCVNIGVSSTNHSWVALRPRRAVPEKACSNVLTFVAS